MAIFDELKSIGKVLQEAGKIELYQQILEVQEKLLEMQKKIFDLDNENKNLKIEINLKKNLRHERDAYWLIDENENKDGPFCTLCYDKDVKLIRIQKGDYGRFGWARCHSCHKYAKYL